MLRIFHPNYSKLRESCTLSLVGGPATGPVPILYKKNHHLANSGGHPN